MNDFKWWKVGMFIASRYEPPTDPEAFLKWMGVFVAEARIDELVLVVPPGDEAFYIDPEILTEPA